MFLDLHEGVLEEFAAFGPQQLTFAERRSGYARPRVQRLPEFDVDDPSAIAAEAARLAAIAQERSRTLRPSRTRRGKKPQRAARRCLRCRRVVQQPRFGRAKTYCDAVCKQEYLGYLSARCRVCRQPLYVPKHGGNKVYCSSRCQDVADRSRRAPPPRSSRPCGYCRTPVAQPKTGKYRQFCDHRCRQRCYAARAGRWPSRTA